ncbi:TPA: hypothetical protein HA239_00950 [Candidatus Woesearchaeota archaeon]|nr:hypothetical protein QT06_C0001G0229 [archaeon GW2011_AR15]MBS3103971.1 hypothetical protein [Candidatus Woesearchaeota archaeon]HIH40961.1 hypothetical protein [Candidatus Woesearchaeota archaeon]
MKAVKNRESGEIETLENEIKEHLKEIRLANRLERIDILTYSLYEDFEHDAILFLIHPKNGRILFSYPYLSNYPTTDPENPSNYEVVHNYLKKQGLKWNGPLTDDDFCSLLNRVSPGKYEEDSAGYD